MKKFALFASLLISTSAYAVDFPFCNDFRSAIETAAQMSGKEMKDIKFPIQKQIFTGTVSALNSIPSLVGYLAGRKDGFMNFCVVTFRHRGQNMTCIASVNDRPDNSRNVNVANCGTNNAQFMNSDSFIDTIQVIAPYNPRTQQPSRPSRAAQ